MAAPVAETGGVGPTPRLFIATALLAPAALAAGCGDDTPGGTGGLGGVGTLVVCPTRAPEPAAQIPDAPGCQSNPTDYAYPFWDPCQPIETRLANLLATLTIDEKLTLLNGGHPAVPRIGLPGASLGTEALHGLGIAANPNATTGSFNPMSTQFPQAFGLGESWDPEVTKTVGATTGYEARVYNARGVADSGRGVGIDHARPERRSRARPALGPHRGIVRRGSLPGRRDGQGLPRRPARRRSRYLLAACTLKHFAANSNETTRMTSSSNLDARNMREYYTATFRAAVRDGHADGIMTAYNQINGIPAAVSPILKSMVQRRLGVRRLLLHRRAGGDALGGRPALLLHLEQAIGAAIADGAAACCCRAMPLPTVTDGRSRWASSPRRTWTPRIASGAARPLPHRRSGSARRTSPTSRSRPPRRRGRRRRRPRARWT